MGVIESVKKGLSTAKASSSLVVLLFAFSFLWNLVNILIAPGEDALTAGVPATMIGLGIVFIVLSIYMQAGSLGYIHDVVKQGKSDFTKFKASGAKFFFRILGVGIIVVLFVLVLTLLAVFVVFLTGGGENPNPIALVFGAAIALVGLIGVLLVFLAPYVVVVQDTKVIPAIQQSIQTVKSNLLKVIGIGLVLLVVGFAVGFLIGIVMGLLSNVLAGKPGQIATGFLSSIVNAYLGVVTTGSFMAYYLSLGGNSGGQSNS